MRGYPWVLSAALLTVWAVGCKPSGDLDPDMSRPADFGFQTTPEEAILAEGTRAYQVYCVGCHGENGDGQGEAAVFLDPKPRDFIKADFKFSSTRSGKLPTDADLILSIREGLRGSAMPSWELLPDRTIKALVVYIKTFSDKWKQRAPALPIPKVDDPYLSISDKSAAIQRGEAVYHGYATCWTCHPAYVSKERINGYLVAMENPAREVFRPNLVQSEGKINTRGELVYPPDFLRDFVRAGASVDILYRSIAAGISGTAMPTWVDSIEFPSERDPNRMLVQRSDIWAMAYYVHDLIARRPPRIAEDAIVIRERPQWISLIGEPSPYAAASEEEATTGEEFLDEDEE